MNILNKYVGQVKLLESHFLALTENQRELEASIIKLKAANVAPIKMAAIVQVNEEAKQRLEEMANAIALSRLELACAQSRAL